MKVLLLADINSEHIQKWAVALSDRGFQIGIFSFSTAKTDWYLVHKILILSAGQSNESAPSVSKKLAYILFLPKLIQAIHSFNPSILHAHYASSYGLLGALSGFKPFMVSAWGSDILDFPKKSFFHAQLMRFIFWRAQKINVTSTLLRDEIKRYTNKPTLIIPFGVNLAQFYQNKDLHIEKSFTFGCVKHFEKIYNIDKVVIAFSQLAKKYPLAALKLKLIGDGSEKIKIQALAEQVGNNASIEFIGKIKNSEVPLYLNNMDVLVNVSEHESFGVSVIEAMACKVPVIVSNASGFKDVVPNSDYAYITVSTHVNAIFLAMETYYLDTEKRDLAVTKGFELVKEKFNWADNILQMQQLYYEFIPKYRSV